MIKTTPHITLTAEQDKRETTICIVWASVVVFGMLALLLHGIAFMSWTEPTMEEIYRNKRIEAEQEKMQNYMMIISAKQNGLKYEYQNHKHNFWTGKVKQGTAK